MRIQPAERTKGVQEYYFSRKQKDLDAVSAERAAKGLGPLVNLGIGAPDGMPPQAAIDTLKKVAQATDSHKYQNYKGLPVLRQAFADWYTRYYGVTLNPNGGIQPLVGSKEGILLISLSRRPSGNGPCALHAPSTREVDELKSYRGCSGRKPAFDGHPFCLCQERYIDWHVHRRCPCQHVHKGRGGQLFHFARLWVGRPRPDAARYYTCFL